MPSLHLQPHPSCALTARHMHMRWSLAAPSRVAGLQQGAGGPGAPAAGRPQPRHRRRRLRAVHLQVRARRRTVQLSPWASQAKEASTKCTCAPQPAPPTLPRFRGADPLVFAAYKAACDHANLQRTLTDNYRCTRQVGPRVMQPGHAPPAAMRTPGPMACPGPACHAEKVWPHFLRLGVCRSD